MTPQQIKQELKEILKSIDKNKIDAWEDDLENTKQVVILEDFSRKPEGQDYKYNHWHERLQQLIEII